MIKDLIILARPKQWTKNLILFAGLVFSGRFLNMLLISKAVIAFGVFCLLSATIYTFNDVLDLEQDKNHPTKRMRPLASGRVGVGQAVVFALFLFVLAMAFSFYLNRSFQIIALCYLLLMVMYSLSLKHLPILDVVVISVGFVLRALAGSVIIPGLISPWLLVCAFLLALVLGFGKRRHELVLLEESSHHHRKVLTEYSPELLDAMIMIAAGSTLMAYSLYTFSATHSRYMMATIPFVAYGIFRYLYLVHIKGEGGSPESILTGDKPMVTAILLWGLVTMAILYLEKAGYLINYFK